YLDIEKILIHKYLKLNLSIKEVKMLLLLFKQYHNQFPNTLSTCFDLVFLLFNHHFLIPK
ncbi:MAG: hypothetical protein Q8761_03130, partial [Sweet potato little leaf phytoplasma]|nr:hypothetical protein [Sweet potato little leaf phytoplasma]